MANQGVSVKAHARKGTKGVRAHTASRAKADSKQMRVERNKAVAAGAPIENSPSLVAKKLAIASGFQIATAVIMSTFAAAAIFIPIAIIGIGVGFLAFTLRGTK